MATKKDFKNIEELRAEIARLKILKSEQEAYLGDQFDALEYKLQAPMRLYDRARSFFPSIKEAFLSEASNSVKGTDWVTNSLKIGLPFLFNKVLFRKAGFIKKGLLLLASQQAAGFLNQDRLTGIIDGITSLVKPSKKGRKLDTTDFGIPPDSETY